MFRALRIRLALIDAAVLLLVLVAIGVSGYGVLSAALDRAATDELRQVADAQVREILEHEGEVTTSPSSEESDPSQAAILVGVFDASGVAIDDGIGDPTWLRPFDTEVTDVVVAGQSVRVVTKPARLDGRTVAQVVAAHPLARQQAILRQVRDLLWLGGGIGLALSLIAGWWLAGRALVPVVRAYEAQAAFAANASHELRSPLAYIRAGVEVLAAREPTLGGQVLGEIDYMTGLTERMLRLARAERGTVGLEPTRFDLADACRTAGARATAAHGLRLEQVGESTAVVGDRVTTEAILDALLENVAQHGGGAATLRWEATGGRAMVEVADAGPGIPPELHEAMLQRFARTDASRTRSTGGAGLGLSIARALAKAQGGTLTLAETPGGGLTVRFDLALA